MIQHTIIHQYARDRNIEDITFVINKEGLPELATKVADQAKEEKILREQSERWNIFKEILTDHLPMTNRDLVAEYKFRTNCGDTKAQSDIKKTLNETFICKTDDGLYQINNAPF